MFVDQFFELGARQRQELRAGAAGRARRHRVRAIEQQVGFAEQTARAEICQRNCPVNVSTFEFDPARGDDEEGITRLTFGNDDFAGGGLAAAQARGDQLAFLGGEALE